MWRKDFFYHLPDELIAREPPDTRGSSRLLVLGASTGTLLDSQFDALTDFLRAGDLLVFNDTKVIPARLIGRKETGGRVEILLERIIGKRQFLAQLRANRCPKPDSVIYLSQDIKLRLRQRQDDMFVLEVIGSTDVSQIMEQLGRLPLPPYIQREDTALDAERYQTIYCKKPGAVAAPTAGLHFTEALIQDIRQRDIDTAFVTLHIGAGTFQPVRAENIADHRMHSEYLQVSADVCDRVKSTKSRGGRIVAVGTTVVRSLEMAALASSSAGVEGLQAYDGETDIFICPGYEFKVVDALLTNFHLPESTLLMLVAAFAGHDQIMRVYQHAIAQRYRFFSYGDAMLLLQE